MAKNFYLIIFSIIIISVLVMVSNRETKQTTDDFDQARTTPLVEDIQSLAMDIGHVRYQESIEQFLRFQQDAKGRFFFYDEHKGKMRTITFSALNENIRQEGDAYFVSVDFVDENTDESLRVKFTFRNWDGVPQLSSYTLEEVNEEIIPAQNYLVRERINRVEQEIQQLIEEYRDENGTLFYFDQDKGMTRTLRIKGISDQMKEVDGNYLAYADFKDQETQEKVRINFQFKEKNDQYRLVSYGIPHGAGTLPKKRTQLMRETKERIRKSVQEYIALHDIADQNIFNDEGNPLPGDLEFLEVQKRIRKYDEIYFATVIYRNRDNGDVVAMDVVVNNSEGYPQIKGILMKK